MGDIAIANDATVQDEVKKLVSTGFAARGITLGVNSTEDGAVNIEIVPFWGWFRPGFAKVAFETDIECTVTIQGETTRSFTVTGHGKNNGQEASDANWIKSFDMVIKDFLANFATSAANAGL